MNSDPATGIDQAVDPPAGWLCHLLQAGDSMYPTGGYAHSFGLEGLVSEGVVRDRATLRTFLLTMALPALERADLPLTAHAWRAFQGHVWQDIADVSFLAAALKPAREVRLASENMGRQRAELAARLHPGSVADEYVQRATAAPWPFAAPISAALEARVFGAPLTAAMTAYAYAALAGLLAAAMKLLRLGQNAAQSLLTEALGSLPASITTATALPRAEIGSFNPWLDIASARHESADARLFIS